MRNVIKKLIFACVILSLFIPITVNYYVKPPFLKPPIVIPPLPKLTKVDFILVEKSKRTMSVYLQGQFKKSFKIALGPSSVGPKTQEGDRKTPEGNYLICGKNPRSKYHLALVISYPNKTDKKNAAKKHVSPGSNILIHGLHPAFSRIGSLHTSKDWTLGCIAITDPEIEELYAATSIGTKIVIRP